MQAGGWDFRAGSELGSAYTDSSSPPRQNTGIEAFGPSCPKQEPRAGKAYSPVIDKGSKQVAVKIDVRNQPQMRLSNQDRQVTMKDRNELWPC